MLWSAGRGGQLLAVTAVYKTRQHWVPQVTCIRVSYRFCWRIWFLRQLDASPSWV